MKVYASKEYVEEKWIERRIAWVDGGMVELMPETTQAPDEDTNGIAMTFVPEAGKTYIVNWNGTTYECLAYELTMEGITGIVFGNSEVLANFGITAEKCDAPFAASYVPEQGGYLVIYGDSALDESGNVTLSVYCNDTTIHTIEPEFLPNGVPYVVEGGGGEVIFPKTTLTVPNVDNDLGLFTTESPLMFEAGTSYIVNWNGTEYSCACQTMSMEGVTALVLGDGSQLGLQSNGEPFMIFTSNENAGEWMTIVMDMSQSMTTTTLSIVSGGSTKIQKLDNRCLDLEWYATMVEAELVPETSVTFAIGNVSTVDGRPIYVANISQEVDMTTFSLGDSIRVNIDGNITDLVHAGNGSELGWGADSHIFTIGGIEPIAALGNAFPIVVYSETNKVFSVLLLLSAETQMKVKIVRLKPNPLPEKYLPKSIPAIQTAEVGQAIVVKAVDENGKPTEWETADMSSGGGKTTWDDLEGKPFGEEQAFEPIVWDGNTEGKETIDVNSMTFYKIPNSENSLGAVIDRREIIFKDDHYDYLGYVYDVTDDSKIQLFSYSVSTLNYTEQGFESAVHVSGTIVGVKQGNAMGIAPGVYLNTNTPQLAFEINTSIYHKIDTRLLYGRPYEIRVVVFPDDECLYSMTRGKELTRHEFARMTTDKGFFVVAEKTANGSITHVPVKFIEHIDDNDTASVTLADGRTYYTAEYKS